MISPRRHLIYMLSLALVVGCDSNVSAIDARSAEAFTRSIVEVRANLDSARRPTFDSLLGLVLHNGNVVNDSLVVTDSIFHGLKDTLRLRMTGLNLGGLRTLADSLRKAHLVRRLTKSHTSLLFALIDRTIQYERLQELEAVDTDWSQERLGFVSFRMTLDNHVRVALSKVRFHGELITPGRTIPWNEGAFTVELRAGIEPEERRTFTHELYMARNMDWQVNDVPEHAELRLEPLEIYGPDGEILASVRIASELSTRIESLRQEIERLERELEGLDTEGETSSQSQVDSAIGEVFFPR